MFLGIILLDFVNASNLIILSPSDIGFKQDAAGILAQRDGTTAQEFRIYETFTDASNYERLELLMGGNVATIQTDSAGTGDALILRLRTVDAGNIQFYTNNAARWEIEASTGDFVPLSNGNLSIGNPSRQVLDVHVSNQLVHGGDTNTHLGFNIDEIILTAGGIELIKMNDIVGVVVNEGGIAAADVRIETDTVTNALFIDAGVQTATWGIPEGHSNTAVALGAAATTFSAATNFVTVTGDGGSNTIATITSGTVGETLTLLFVDALVTITDDNTHAADSTDLSAAFTSADDTTLTLLYDGTSWYEVSRSVN